MTSNPYPRLWLTAEDDKQDALHVPLRVPTGFSSDGSTASFIRARMVPNTDLISLPVQRPPRNPLLAMVGNSLVVGQEFALTCLFLAWHRVITDEKDGEGENGAGGERRQVISRVVVAFTVMLVLYYSEAAQNDIRSASRQINLKRDKMIVRSTDALLLAAILRLLSAVLRTLTASYSSDTVNALAIGGMVVHLLACDYSYAIGVQRKATIASSSRIKRPTFMGGTVSLNAAFFSTTLLASRLPTNVVSYAFISSAVILFAFYPAARHVIATMSIDSFVSPCLLITTAVSFATLLLLCNTEKVAFLSILFSICIVSPTVKWWLHCHKKIMLGPWDIAHIVVDDKTMINAS